MAIDAGGMHVRMLKKRIIKETSRSFNPYTAVPRAPVGKLSLVRRRTRISSQGSTYGNTQSRSVNHTVNRLS